MDEQRKGARARGRIGRYPNPTAALRWHRDPSPFTRCEPYRLPTPDDGEAEGWLYSRGGEDTVVILMHPWGEYAHHYLVPRLVDEGIAVFCENSRYLNNESVVIYELLTLDVAAGVAAMRSRFDRVVLCGNSGGGSLLTFYLAQALAPNGERLKQTAAGDSLDLNQFDLEVADAMIYLASHAGEGQHLVHSIDPSVTDESDPVSCDSKLDMYALTNGFEYPPTESRYSDLFLEQYRAAQRARVERIDSAAMQRIAVRREARVRWKKTGLTEDRRLSLATRFMTVYRTDADPRCTDLSLDPSKRTYGSLWGVRPDWINYGPVGFARVVSPEAWLSTWSANTSLASIERTGVRMTLPCLHISYEGDHGIFPSDNESVCASLKSAKVTKVKLGGDHYGFPVEAGRDLAAGAIVEWLSRS